MKGTLFTPTISFLFRKTPDGLTVIFISSVWKESRKSLDTVYPVRYPFLLITIRAVDVTTLTVQRRDASPDQEQTVFPHCSLQHLPEQRAGPRPGPGDLKGRRAGRQVAREEREAGCSNFQLTSLLTTKHPLSAANFQLLASPRQCGKRWMTAAKPSSPKINSRGGGDFK